ncbi:PREDICTED: roundabout homolog 1-like isoform X9 [Branchiostoma belcheri]|uniref:Roundabout homolog 1-like isoform X9 n=1 Tax=Branchiostoma belcheri TaxID=7741 RepID=A0A6P5A3S4_BRABE|nr:PREDICTED: roundabout homolog 1-like isoform X9 [Branchiostoma belcheri]
MDCKMTRILLLTVIAVLVLRTAKATRYQQDDFPPRIIEHPSDIIVPKGEPATLNCKAEGQPTPTIQWFKDGQPVETDLENARSHRMLLPSGSLFFLRIIHGRRSKPDAGRYQCVATNYLGRAVSNNATLEVAVLRDDFKENPRSLTVAVGEPAVLQCDPPRGYPEPRITWEKNGLVVRNEGERIRVLESGKLMISEVKKSDAGTYVCIGTNMVGRRVSEQATLSVYVKPSFSEAPEDVTAIVKEDVEFKCKVRGDPSPQVTWSREESALPLGRARILDNNNLKIERVTSADEGTYVCTAENLVGRVEGKATLTIHERPTFKTKPRDQVIGLNKIATFLCETAGNPPPAVFWQKEGSQVLMFPNQNHGRFKVTSNGELIISGVQKADEGWYVCSALSVAGSETERAYLKVAVLSDRPPPIIRQGPTNMTLNIGELAMLPCQASGNPAPSIRWLKDSNPILATDHRIMLLDRGTLQISDVRIGDSGMYTCIASSESGETTWTASLNVHEPTDPSQVFPPRMQPESSDLPGPPYKPAISNITKSSLRLTWRPSAKSGASEVRSYTVEYFSHDLGTGWVTVASDVRSTTYVVRNLRTATSYMFLIRAQNGQGLSLPSPVSDAIRTKGDSAIPTLSPEDQQLVEQKLRSVQIEMRQPVAISSTEIQVNWQVRNFKGLERYLQGFHIMYRPSYSNAPYSTETVTDKRASTAVVNGLAKFTSYDIMIQPFFNERHQGPPSSPVTSKTLEDAPSAAPQGVTATLATKDSIRIQWEGIPRDKANGVIKGYQVWCLGNETRFHKNMTTNMTSVVIRDLIPGMLYRIEVAAFTTAPGYGPSSEHRYIQMDPNLMASPGEVSLSLAQQISDVVKTPAFIAGIGAFFWLALLIFSIWLYRRHKKKKSALRGDIGGSGTVPNYLSTLLNLNRDRDNAAAIADSNHHHHQHWLDQSWPNTSAHHHPNQTGCTMTTCCSGSGGSISEMGNNTTGRKFDINDMVYDNLGKEKAKMQPEVETGVPPYMVHNANMPADVESLPEYAEVGNQPHLKTFLTKQQNMNHLGSPAPYASTSVVDTNLNENLNLEKSVSENGSEKWMPTFTRGKRKNGRRTPDAYTPDHKVNNDMYPQENSEGSQMSTSLSNPMYDNRPRSPYSDGSATDDSSRRRRRAQNKLPPSAAKQAGPPLNWADLLPPPPEHPPPSEVDSPPGTPPRSPYSSHRSDRPTPDSPNTDVTLPCLPAHLEDTGQGPGLRIELPGYGYLDAPSDADTSVRDEDYENRDFERARHLGEQTPASSMGDLESSVTGNRDSMIAGWASATDDNDSVTSASNRSSAAESSDGSFFTDADFASAVAAAAESAGLTVQGSVVSDPNAGKKQFPGALRHKRSGSPFSTDSNASAALAQKPRPHPPSHRRRQDQSRSDSDGPSLNIGGDIAPSSESEQSSRPKTRPDVSRKPAPNRRQRQEPEELYYTSPHHHEWGGQLSPRNVYRDELSSYGRGTTTAGTNTPPMSPNSTSSRGSTGRRRERTPSNQGSLRNGSSGRDGSSDGGYVQANPIAFENKHAC